MKKSGYIYFAILMVSLIANQTVLADGSRKTGSAKTDVKIKVRQTVGGQTFENTTYIKGKRQRVEQNMGGMQTVNITQCDLRRGIQVMPQSQTYLVDVWETTNQTTAAPGKKTATKGGVVTSTITLKDTGERKQMMGYTARHIITTIESNSSPDACSVSKNKMEIDGWYIDAAFGDGDGCGNERYINQPTVAGGGCQDRYETKQIGTAKKGYPVSEKMTMLDGAGKVTTTMQNEVVEISNATLDAALFDVPSGYREVKDATDLYASAAKNNSSNNSGGSRASAYIANSDPSDTPMSNNVQNLSRPSNTLPTQVGAKKAGMIRIGVSAIKTGAVGEGISAAELAGAIQNTLTEYLKSSTVELVALEAKLPSAADAEAKSKDCDYVLYTQVSHKKGGGGGGFGMFKKIAPALSSVVPMVGVAGSVAGMVAGQVASTVIQTAAGMAGNMKAKDELALDIKLDVANGASAGGATTLAKQFKQKAKGDGDDIITPLIEQAAQAILTAVGK